MDSGLNLLGLIYVARKMLLGEEVLNNLNKIKLIVFAYDISDKSRQRIIKKCTYYKLPYLDIYNTEQLSNALGKKMIKLIGITDSGFAKSLSEKCK